MRGAEGTATIEDQDGVSAAEPAAAQLLATASRALSEISRAARRASEDIHHDMIRLLRVTRGGGPESADPSDPNAAGASVRDAAVLGGWLIDRSDEIQGDCEDMLARVRNAAAAPDLAAVPLREFAGPQAEEIPGHEPDFAGPAAIAIDDFDLADPGPRFEAVDHLDQEPGPGPGFDPGGGPTAPDPVFISEGVRVLVAQMALAGSGSDQIAERLRSEFDVPNADWVVAESLRHTS